jgi:hypothetical protein
MSEAISGYPMSAAVVPVTTPDPIVSLFQLAIRAITGIPGAMVRPRWQPNPPLRPGPTVNWCGAGVGNFVADANPYYDTQGTAGRLIRHESGELSVSMYGPACQENCRLLRDGFNIPQNRWALGSAGIAMTDATAAQHLPELVADVWYERADITFTFNREVRRIYPILSIVSASGVLHANQAGADFSIDTAF